jgi:hypothetical protein
MKRNLQTKQVQLGIVIQEYKNMMSEAKRQNDAQIINNAVEFYINTITPLLAEIQSIKYPYNKVEMINNTYHLIQKKNTIEQTYMLDNESKVIAFVTGTTNKKSNTRSQSAKASENIPPPPESKEKKKKKSKPLLELITQSLGLSQEEPENSNKVEEEDEDEEEENEENEENEEKEEKENEENENEENEEKEKEE